MSRYLLFKHGNLLTVFKNSVDRVFLQPRHFLKLLLIADALKKMERISLPQSIINVENSLNLNCKPCNRDLTPRPFAIAAVLAWARSRSSRAASALATDASC
jgi:hypothetical protein